MKDPTIGVIGTGYFATYFISALRRGGHKGRILLSPHSRKAQALARDQNCEVAEDESHLVGEADWMLVAIRPEQFDGALATLTLRPGQIVLSAVAGVSVADLRLHLGEVVTVVRIMPSSYIAAMPDGLIPLFPAVEEVQRILAHAGTVVAFESEAQFELSTVGACMSGWMYHFMDSLEDWFVRQGIAPHRARLLVAGNIAGAVAQATANPGRSLQAISDEIATEGTYTKLGLDILLGAEAAKPWRKALDAVADKLG